VQNLTTTIAGSRRRHSLRNMEGRRVGVALRDGSRLDDCLLVSAGRGAVDSLWLFDNGADTFARHEDVIDLWPTN
jgi:hypothetical protein